MINEKIKKGFTLIELLVSASILGVVMLTGIITYQNSKRTARDARRRDDLSAIREAMEQYYSVEGRYPAACPAAGSTFSTTGGEVIFQSFPTDPRSGWTYSGTCEISRYCFSAQMENTGSGNCSGCSCLAGQDECSFSAGATRFCVKHAQ